MTGDRARLSLKLSVESWVNLITAGPQKLEQGYLVNCHSRQAVTDAQIVVNGILNTEHSKVVTLPHRGPINHTHTSIYVHTIEREIHKSIQQYSNMYPNGCSIMAG